MPEPARGRLKIFLGYAAGVGKTYQMLLEARRLRQEGVDVAIGYFEPHARQDTIALTEGLEFMPRKVFHYREAAFEDMDTEALIARCPRLAVVDELAHTNAPGAPREKRWQDVQRIQEAGIDVLTSLNVQHIESLNDQVWHVTGVRVRETVPDWVLAEADEVQLVDVTPRALQHRLERGVVYAPEKARLALDNFFTEQNLTALRELALRQTAHALEDRREHAPPGPGVRPAASADERILIWLTPHPATAMLIRRGRRVADFLNSPCTAVYSEQDAGVLGAAIAACRNLRIAARPLEGSDPAKSVAAYARETGVTQIFVTRHAPHIQKLVQLVRDHQVTIVAERVRPG